MSPPPGLDAARDGEVSAQIRSLHPAQPTSGDLPLSPPPPNLSSPLDSSKTQLCLYLPRLHLSSRLLKYPPPCSRLTTFSPALLPRSHCRDPSCCSGAALSPCPRQPLPQHIGCWLTLPLWATFKHSEITSEILPCPKLARKSRHYKNKTILCVHAHFRLPFKPELVSLTLAEEQRGAGVKRQA